MCTGLPVTTSIAGQYFNLLPEVDSESTYIRRFQIYMITTLTVMCSGS